MSALDDGIYDVLVVDAREGDDDVVHLELAVVSGARKGDLVTLSGPRGQRDATDWLGLPATLRVTDGIPRLAF